MIPKSYNHTQCIERNQYKDYDYIKIRLSLDHLV